MVGEAYIRVFIICQTLASAVLTEHENYTVRKMCRTFSNHILRCSNESTLKAEQKLITKIITFLSEAIYCDIY